LKKNKKIKGAIAPSLPYVAPPLSDWISYVLYPNTQSKPCCGNIVPELSSGKFYFDISKNI
jgi:hypothetical protein